MCTIFEVTKRKCLDHFSSHKGLLLQLFSDHSDFPLAPPNKYIYSHFIKYTFVPEL